MAEDEPNRPDSTVELRFTYQPRELTMVFQTRLKELRSQRVLLGWTGPVPFGVLGAVVLFVVFGLKDDGWSWPVNLVLSVVFGAVIAFIIRRSTGRAHAKATATGGEILIVVGPDGLRSSNAMGTTYHNLTAFRPVIERPEGFVLLSTDKLARHIIYLPLRGLVDPDQADRLRVLLGADR